MDLGQGGVVYFNKSSCLATTPPSPDGALALPPGIAVCSSERSAEAKVPGPGALPDASLLHTLGCPLVVGGPQGRWVVSVSLSGGLKTNKQNIYF